MTRSARSRVPSAVKCAASIRAQRSHAARSSPRAAARRRRSPCAASTQMRNPTGAPVRAAPTPSMTERRGRDLDLLGVGRAAPVVPAEPSRTARAQGFEHPRGERRPPGERIAVPRHREVVGAHHRARPAPPRAGRRTSTCPRRSARPPRRRVPAPQDGARPRSRAASAAYSPAWPVRQAWAYRPSCMSDRRRESARDGASAIPSDPPLGVVARPPTAPVRVDRADRARGAHRRPRQHGRRTGARRSATT